MLMRDAAPGLLRGFVSGDLEGERDGARFWVCMSAMVMSKAVVVVV